MNRGFTGVINSSGRSALLSNDINELRRRTPPSVSAFHRRVPPFLSTFESVENVQNLIEFFNLGIRTRTTSFRAGPLNSWNTWVAVLNNDERSALSSDRVYMKVALTLSLQETWAENPYAQGGRFGSVFVSNDTNFFKANRTTFLRKFENLLTKLSREYKITAMFDLYDGRLIRKNNDDPNSRVRYGLDYEHLFNVKVRIKWVKLDSVNQSRWITGPLTTDNPGARFVPDRENGITQRFGCYVKDTSAVGLRIDKFLRKKRSVIFMNNKDNSCFSRSLCVCLMKMFLRPGGDQVSEATATELYNCGIINYLREGGYSNAAAYRSIIKGSKLQLQLAIVLSKHAGIDFRSSVTWSDIAVFESCFKVQLRVFDARNRLKKCYEGDPCFETKVYMISNRMHFHPLLSRKGLMCRNYECKSCDVLYDHIDDHQRCTRRCFYCREVPCVGLGRLPSGAWIKCRECLRSFPNPECFIQHKTRSQSRERSVCDRVKSCGEFRCKLFDPRDYDDIKSHKCGDVKCTNCLKLCDPCDHMCAMKTKKSKKHRDRFLFFDFECSQESSDERVHRVTHVVVKDEHDVTTTFTPSINDEEPVLSRFCDWMFATAGCVLPKDKGVTAIAHNGRGYDFQFILQWCLSNDRPPTRIIRSGQKIMSMEIGGVRFIDSLSFLTMPLSAFPKTFGLKEHAKGYFPHLFNTRSNVGYIGPIPDSSYFMPDGMSVKARHMFMEWYESVRDEQNWDFDEEILKYCVSDVDILRRGCLSFREIFIDETGVDPFSHITIAGACMSTFRSRYLEENTIFPLRRSLDSWVRRGFFGGRTQVFKAHAVAGRGSIKYVDVMSLYPWVNTNCEYPVGAYKWKKHDSPLTTPRSILAELESFGIFEVDVTSPRNLLHPVLPHRRDDGTLLFDLSHKSRGVYATPELRLALSKGYVVTKVYASLTWESTTTSLFKDYMLSFLKIKQEASGWGDKSLRGSPVETDSDKLEWIRQHMIKEGVSLDISKVKHNPGLRAVSKLCLNSLWGKLGQREVRRKTEYIRETDKICKMLETTEVHDIIEFEDSIHEVTFSKDIPPNDLRYDTPANWNTSAAIAAFTTSHARVKLYSALDIVQERALYCDTDSVIYEDIPDEPGIEIGDTLGSWTDELGGDDIQEFIGAGPKTYAYRTMSGKEEVKCKGFTVSYVNSQGCLSFDNFKRVVFHKYAQGSEEPILSTTTPFKIVREKNTKSVTSVCNVKKVFSATLERKGVVTDDFRVLPFGYVDESTERRGVTY